MRDCQRGSILPFVALLVLASGGLIVGIARVGADAVARSRAVTAADAAALAGAAEGEDAARAVARANGGEVVAYETDGAEVEVTVRVGGAEAAARARRVEGVRIGTGGNPSACTDANTRGGGCPPDTIPYTPMRADGPAPDEHDRGPRRPHRAPSAPRR